MNDLVVDGELPALIADHQDTNRATAVREAVRQSLQKIALVQDGKVLLHIARFGHGNYIAIIADVKDTVLLEDRAQHVLYEDGRSRIADEAALFLELLREEVHAEIAMLSRLSGSGDADNLARAALENENVTNADVMAWDGDCVWWARSGASLRVAWAHGGHFTVLLDNDVLLAFNVAVTSWSV